MRMRFRSKAARCMGNIKGPKVSRSFVKLQAGWKGDNLWPRGIKAAPSDCDLFLVCALPAGVDVGLKPTTGEANGVSLAAPSGEVASPALCSSQYFSSISVCFLSADSFLYAQLALCDLHL